MSNKQAKVKPGQLHCLRCGNIWWPKLPATFYTPKCCSVCKSRHWNTPKRDAVAVTKLVPA